MSFFNRIKNLFGPSSSYKNHDFYYEHLLNNYKHLDSYCSLLRVDKREKISIQNPIPLFQKKTNSKDFFKKKYGKPDHHATNNFPFGNIEIYFYRTHLGNQRVKLELHFFENKLLMLSYKFSHLDHQSEKKHLLESIQEKYDINKPLLANHHFIKGADENLILINDNVEFSIYYLNGKLKDIENKEYHKNIDILEREHIKNETNLLNDL